MFSGVQVNSVQVNSDADSNHDLKEAVEAFDRKPTKKEFSISYQINYQELNVGQELGRGSYGVVYQGTWRTHTDVAIKQLLSDDISDEAKEEFETESQVMARLRSPHIVQFYGYCLNPRNCIVMEYMPNGSLYSVLKNTKQPLDWTIRARIAIDIASGVAFLHQEHIVHRDIKSLNVLLDKYYSAKLTDFGLSKVKTETKSQSMATKTSKDSVGTVAWMAPELFKRKAVYTQKSDIYSLGITFWELAARKIPYSGDAQEAIPAFVQQGEREDIPTDCPPKLASLIAVCWDGVPDKRPDADAVVTYLKSEQTNFAQFLPWFAIQRTATNNLPANVLAKSTASPVVQCAMNANELKELQEFLTFVAEGEQDKAEAMLKNNPVLALAPGDVTDLSKRTFNNITGFQYACWALDWHMWTMMRKYLPDAEARQQAEGFETGPWVKRHGVNAQHLLDNLVKALQIVIDLYQAEKWAEGDTAWVQQVGGAQLLLPAHVTNEYCHPTRSFNPLPNFRDAAALPRTRKVGAGEWFTAVDAVRRGGQKTAERIDGRIRYCSSLEQVWASMKPYGLDRDSIRALSSTRIAQREELINELKPRSVQRKAA